MVIEAYNHVEAAHTQHTGNLDKRPCLLIFHASDDYLCAEVKNYGSLGYKAIGVKMMLSERDLEADGRLRYPYVKRGIEIHYGVATPAHLAALLEKLKPSALLSDGFEVREMSDDEGTVAGRKLIAAARKISPHIPCLIRSGRREIPVDAVLENAGYGLMSKLAGAHLADSYFRQQLAKASGPTPG